MKLPILIVNYKNYPEIIGIKGLNLAKVCEKVTKELNVNIALSPPTPFLNYIAREVNLPIFAQHVDPNPLGNTTGFLVVEMLKEAGAIGSLVNHSEHRLKRKVIEETLLRLRRNGLISVLCAKDPKEVGRFAKFNPDFLAIEPPELIGTGIAVSQAKPDLITQSINKAKKWKTKVICGAGISSKEDVKRALELGTVGVLVSSSIVKAKDWEKKIRELAEALAYHQI